MQVNGSLPAWSPIAVKTRCLCVAAASAATSAAAASAATDGGASAAAALALSPGACWPLPAVLPLPAASAAGNETLLTDARRTTEARLP